MASHINSDLLLDILTRMPLQDLAKIRTISKEWNELTYEPSFTELHTKRTKLAMGFIIQGLDYGSPLVNFALNAYEDDDDDAHGSSINISLDFLPNPVDIVSCHDGILLCKGLDNSYRRPGDYRYYVCKPTTKEWILIPTPKTRYFEENVSLVVLRRKPLHYKIVRICDQCTYKHRYNYRCEVFDSESWRWKRMEDINLPWNLFFPKSNTTGVVVSGIAYRFMLPVLKDNYSSILAFDLYHEKWELIRFPNLIPGDPDFSWWAELVNCEGKLGLLYVRKEDNNEVMHLWEMNKEIWIKKRTASIKTFMEAKLHGPLALFNSDAVLMGGYNNVVFCKLSGKTMNVVQTGFILNRRLFFFCSDFEPCNLNKK